MSPNLPHSHLLILLCACLSYVPLVVARTLIYRAGVEVPSSLQQEIPTVPQARWLNQLAVK